ncbi:MAG: hypothetical protein RLZZ624_1011 [Cyanobacteriota bacterium]|jgi:hypothetical protein
MKLQRRYDQASCRLQVEGLPDVSAGQSSQAIGIITGWQLQLAARPELEGRKEHLIAMAEAVLPYARHLISGVRRPFGGPEAPVSIAPFEVEHEADAERRRQGHELTLRSSQPDTPPLTLRIDDAELADLVRCLDRLRLDPLLQVPLQLPEPQPLRAKELQARLPLHRRLAAPVGGALALGLLAGLSWFLPTPAPQRAGQATQTAPPTKLAPSR